MIGKSLASKGCLNLIFNWQHYYYTLTNDGISFLKKELGIDNEDVKPITHKERTDMEEGKRRVPRKPRDNKP